MADLSLNEAARYIGVLPANLQSWAWANSGPRTIGKSYWFPRYRQEDLDRWLADNKPPEQPKGPEYKLGTKRVQRVRKVQT